MSIPTKTKVKAGLNIKSEFLMELAAGHARWSNYAATADKQEAEQAREYALSYERMLCVHTTPEDEENKK